MIAAESSIESRARLTRVPSPPARVHGHTNEKTIRFSAQSSPNGLRTAASISLECAACVVPARTTLSIDSRSGQISTLAALDHEAKSSWSVIVRANDGQGGVDATRTSRCRPYRRRLCSCLRARATASTCVESRYRPTAARRSPLTKSSTALDQTATGRSPARPAPTDGSAWLTGRCTSRVLRVKLRKTD